MAEVKFESKEIAHRIRRGFAEKKKAGVDMGRVFIANSVTLGTRVRIDILKAIAKKYSNDKQDFHVVAYTSRPVLQVKQKGSDQKPMGLTFIDAITRYGRELVEGELGDAYRRTGKAFQGQLQQNFVVLRDRMSAPEGFSGGPSSATPKKRQREEEGNQNQTQLSKRGAKGGGVRGTGRGKN